MKIVRTRYIPKRVKAISLFGFLLVRPRTRVTNNLLTHEEIHFCQQKETLFVFFFIIYAISWLTNLPLCLFNKRRGQPRYTKKMTSGSTLRVESTFGSSGMIYKCNSASAVAYEDSTSPVMTYYISFDTGSGIGCLQGYCG